MGHVVSESIIRVPGPAESQGRGILGGHLSPTGVCYCHRYDRRPKVEVTVPRPPAEKPVNKLAPLVQAQGYKFPQWDDKLGEAASARKRGYTIWRRSAEEGQ